MILGLAYTNDDLDFYKEVEELLEQYPLVRLESFCRDKYRDQKNYYKLTQHYATKSNKFMVLTDDEHRVVQPFYMENNTCSIDYLKIVLDHWTLYNPIENGHNGSEEKT